VILLNHATAAELLFAAGLIPASVTDAGRAVAAEYRRRHGDLVGAAAEMAAEFGDHPQSALERMRACLAVAPLRVELPDSYGPAWLGYAEPQPHAGQPHAGQLLAAMWRAQLRQDFPPKLDDDQDRGATGRDR
jgi:hypothetical protein